MNRQALNLKEEAAKLESQLESSCNDLKMSEGELVPSTRPSISVVARDSTSKPRRRTIIFVIIFRVPSSGQIPGNRQEGQCESRRRLQIELSGRPEWKQLFQLGSALSYGDSGSPRSLQLQCKRLRFGQCQMLFRRWFGQSFRRFR